MTGLSAMNTWWLPTAVAAVLLLFIPAAVARPSLTDDQIRQRVIQQSIVAY